MCFGIFANLSAFPQDADNKALSLPSPAFRQEVMAMESTAEFFTSKTAQAHDIADACFKPERMRQARENTATKALSSTAEMEGKYVLSYQTMLSGSYDGGSLVTISAIEDTDSITITDFWTSGATIKAKVDLAEMTISIPNQVLGTSETYGDYDIVYCSDSGSSYNRSTEITGTISSDGNITITSAWGVFIVSGSYANYYFGIYYSGSTIEEVNGTMSYDIYDTSSATTSAITVDVVVEQESERLLKVKNFYGTGVTIEISLNSSKGAKIASQYVYTNSTYSTGVYTYAVTYSDGYTNLESYIPSISCEQATDTHTISWGSWNLMFAYNGYMYWTGKYYTSGKVETTLDISYPDSYDYTFSGDGTADSPFLVATAAQWNDLSAYMVNEADDFSGKYIRIAADISFADTAIVALGYDGTAFNGDLDGNGKSLSGISSTLSATYSGPVIMSTGTDAHIHDLTLEGDVTSDYSYCGAVIGVLYGKISNVVSNITFAANGTNCPGGIVGYASEATITGCGYGGKLTSSSNYAGGVVGYAVACSITDCTSNGTFNFYGTYSGGVAGFVYNNSVVSGCTNEGSVTGFENYPAGVVGYLYSSSAAGCVNLGVVIGYGSYGTGGVIGGGYSSTITECSNKGSVTAASYYGGGVLGFAQASTVTNCTNDSAVISKNYYGAGVVGAVLNKSTISACYNYGTVTSSSAYSAGVAGYVYVSYVENCSNYGTVTATSTVQTFCAGVVSHIANNATVTDCHNYGSVISSTKYTSGVVGNAYSVVTVKGCINYGTVESSGDYCGGVVGQSYYATIDSCLNEGNVTSSASYIAGVSASAWLSSTYAKCCNNGNVTCTGNNAKSYVAGLIGYCYYSTISDCHNNGVVEAKSPDAGYIAGLIAYCYGSSTTNTFYLTGCTNTSDITSATRSAGLVSDCNANAVINISSCHNTGNITASGDLAGGIAAYLNNYSVIDSCYNLGDVSGANYVGGIAGQCAGTLANVYNSGNITASDFAAGIIGFANSSTASVSTGYTSGAISCDGSNRGNVIGDNIGTVTNMYFLTANSADSTAGLSYAQLGALELEGWTNGDIYTYPRLDDNDHAKACAAAVIPADDDSYPAITKDFYVGTPDGVTWTESSGSVEIDGNNVIFTESFSGSLTMTATCGDVEAVTELSCNVEVDGISNVAGNTRSIVSERFLTVSGVQVTNPVTDRKAIYIITRTYDDGTSETVKEAR